MNYANGQRIASRVGGELYYVLADPTGQAVAFADETGQEVGHIFYDPLGEVITSTLSAALAETLAGFLDPATNLQYHGDRYYDAWVGGYIQPNPFGGPPDVPLSLNRFAVSSGTLLQGSNESVSTLVDIGKSFASNSTSNWLGNQLEPIPGRLVHNKLGSWYWVSLSIPHHIPPYYGARMAVEFGQYQATWGPFSLYSKLTHPTGKTEFEWLVRRLPDKAEALAESFYRRSGATLVSWEPFVGGAPGRFWNYSFGLAGVSPELARHFTLGSFAGGAAADLVVGAIWQGVEDELAYGLWSHNPGLAFRRSAAAAGRMRRLGWLEESQLA